MNRDMVIFDNRVIFPNRFVELPKVFNLKYFDVVSESVNKVIVHSFGYTGRTRYPNLREVRSGFYL